MSEYVYDEKDVDYITIWNGAVSDNMDMQDQARALMKANHPFMMEAVRWMHDFVPAFQYRLSFGETARQVVMRTNVPFKIGDALFSHVDGKDAICATFHELQNVPDKAQIAVNNEVAKKIFADLAAKVASAPNLPKGQYQTCNNPSLSF